MYWKFWVETISIFKVFLKIGIPDADLLAQGIDFIYYYFAGNTYIFPNTLAGFLCVWASDEELREETMEKKE